MMEEGRCQQGGVTLKVVVVVVLVVVVVAEVEVVARPPLSSHKHSRMSLVKRWEWVRQISCVCRAFQEGLSKMLSEGSAELKQAFAVSDSRSKTDADSKFNIVPLSCGKITDFHAGVEERIGDIIAHVF